MDIAAFVQPTDLTLLHCDSFAEVVTVDLLYCKFCGCKLYSGIVRVAWILEPQVEITAVDSQLKVDVVVRREGACELMSESCHFIECCDGLNCDCYVWKLTQRFLLLQPILLGTVYNIQNSLAVEIHNMSRGIWRDREAISHEKTAQIYTNTMGGIKSFFMRNHLCNLRNINSSEGANSTVQVSLESTFTLDLGSVRNHVRNFLFMFLWGWFCNRIETLHILAWIAFKSPWKYLVHLHDMAKTLLQSLLAW